VLTVALAVCVSEKEYDKSNFSSHIVRLPSTITDGLASSVACTAEAFVPEHGCSR
jgi:hypothetical protein